ncbi:MAG: hypothetical protein HRT98_00190 [Mycoplasmatales bacterium]|nr:hypothetical protein [Mycoplasmatales bacterium]
MNKKVLIVNCEGKAAKTEENFLKTFYNDLETFAKINNLTSEYEKEQLRNIKFYFKNINYPSLKPFLDASPTYSRIIVFVDRDVLIAWEYVNEILERYNLNRTTKIVFAYPSDGMAFEELISFCFPNPRKVYSISLKEKKLKKYLGERYKGDKNIYKKINNLNKPNIATNIKKNLKLFSSSNELSHLVLFEELIENNN